MSDERLDRQIRFLLEADKLKTILRRTPLSDNSRLENSAEHSWHLALAALTLEEYAPAGTDIPHAVALAIVHDLVEIHAGDTFAYDTAGHDTKTDRERAAADRLFGLLDADQASVFRALWEEFEAQATASSRYANALDRLQPLLLNFQSGGGSWKQYSVTRSKVLRRMEPIRAWMPAAWPYVLDAIERACAATLIVDDRRDDADAHRFNPHPPDSGSFGR
jgi:putative hydrolases of HD superfamily